MVDLLLVTSFLFPGVMVQRIEGESLSVWLATRTLLSVGFNGLLFALLRHGDLYAPSFVTPYLLVGAAMIATLALLRCRRRHVDLGSWREHRLVISVAILVAVLACYWSFFFPPVLEDSTYYHLLLAKVYASPELFDFYSASDNRYTWLLQGAVGGNLIESFLSVFWLYDSEVYRLSPPVFAVVLVIVTSALCSSLGIGSRGQACACLLVFSAPSVLGQASDYYVDMFLAAYVVAAIHALRRTLTLEKWSALVPNALLAAALLGIACWVKQIGLVAISFPIGLALFSCRRDRKRFLLLGSTSLAAALVALEYVMRIPGFPSFPCGNNPPDPARFAGELYALGLPTLFLTSRYLNAGVLALALVLMVAHLAGLVRGPRSPFASYLGWLSGLWGLAVLAGIYACGRYAFLDRWGRYLVPIYPVICVLVVHVAHRLLEQFGGLRGLLRTHRAIAATALAMAICIAPLVPLTELRWLAMHRGGTLSTQPFAPAEAKRVAMYGDHYVAIQFINAEFAEVAGGKVLSENTQIFYLDPPAFEACSIPKSIRSHAQFLDWASVHDLRWILASDCNNAFELCDGWRRTNVTGLLQSEHVTLLATFGDYRVFAIRSKHERARPNDALPGADALRR